MKLIVGLGNPGVKYERTRHNMGAMVVEQFFKNFEPVSKTVWSFEKQFKSDVARIEWQPKHGTLEKVMLIKPQTYMNNSGLAVGLIFFYYKLSPSDIWVVHDEIDLPLGRMRIRLGGSSAGQKGVESIITALKTDKFWRFRMGIGTTHHNKVHVEGKSHPISKHFMKNTEDFVLGSFVGGQWGKARKLIKKGAEAISESLENGFESTQNKFN